MSSKQNFAHYADASSLTTHPVPIAVGSGTNRKIGLIIMREAAQTLNTIVFDDGVSPVAMTAIAGASGTSAGGGNLTIASYYYDIPDALAAGNYTAKYNTSTATNLTSAFCWQVVDAPTGDPEDADFADVLAGTAAISATLTCSAGSFMLSAVLCAAATPTFTWSGDVTEVWENDEANYTTSSADAAIASGGSKTATATGSVTTGNKILVAISFADAVSATPPTPGLSASVVGNRVTVTDESVAGTNPITSVEYDYYDGEVGLSGDWTSATTHEYDPDTERGDHTIRQRVNDGVTAQQEATEAITTATRYIYDSDTVGGRRASSNIVDVPDA